MLLRRLAPVAAALPLALAGCASPSAPAPTGANSPGTVVPYGATPGTSGKDTLRVIDAAAQATEKARSVRMTGHLSESLTGVVPTPGAAPTSVDVHGDFSGVVQTKPIAGRITLTNMTTNGMAVGGTMQEIISPDAFYMSIPALSQQVGTPWVEMRFSDLKALSGLDLKQFLSQAEQMQPGQYIEQLTRSGDVRSLGTATVDGVETTHYAGTVSMADQLALMPKDSRATLGQLIRSAGFHGVHLDVWLDGHGLLRRVVSNMTGDGGTVSIRMDVLAYGVHVDTSPPPASQVTDLGQYLNQSGSGGL